MPKAIGTIIRDWTLPISMLVGSVCYVVFRRCSWALPLKAPVGPGVCLLWQNVINSWQIWSHGRRANAA